MTSVGMFSVTPRDFSRSCMLANRC
jgi:hypothetical protein